MADYDTGIEAYGAVADSSTIVGETINAFDTLNVNNLTINDLKAYIDILITQSGYLTASEIEAKIEMLADAAGILSTAEITNLVVSTVSGLDALTEADANARIETKVAQAILDLNDNADIILDVKTELNRRIDGLRSELKTVQQDGNDTLAIANEVKNDYKFQTENIKQNIKVLETIINSIVESREVHSLISAERNTRTSEIENLQATIATEKTSKDTAIAAVNTKADSLSNQIVTINNQINSTITSLDTNLRNRMLTIEAEARNNAAVLSSLLLSGDELINKLTALNSVDLGTSGNVIINLQEQVEGLVNEVNSSITLLETKADEVQDKVAEFDLIKEEINANLLNTNMTIHSSMENLDGRLIQEIGERKAQADILIRDWATYTAGLTQEFTSTQLRVQELVMQLSEFPNEFQAMIDAEKSIRLQNDSALSHEIFTLKNNLEEKISDVDSTIEIKTINDKITDIQADYLAFENKFVKGTIDQISAIGANLQAQIDLNKTTADSKYTVEAATRASAIVAVNDKIDFEASVRETRIAEFNAELANLNTMVEGLIANQAIGDTTPLTTALDNLNTRYEGLFSQVDTVDDRESTNHAYVVSQLQVLNDTISSVQLTALNDVQSEADARTSTFNDLSGQINTLQGKNVEFIGTVAPAKANFNAVYDAIAAVQAALDLFKVDFDDDIQISLTNMTALITAVDSSVENVAANLTAEGTTRQAADIQLQGNIDIVDAKLPVMRSEIETLITAGDSANAASILALQSDLASETQARIDADATRATELDTFRTELTTTTATLTSTIDGHAASTATGISDLNTSLTAEIASRIAGDDTLTASITAETTARTEADAAITQRLDAQGATIQALLTTEDLNFENLRAVLDMVQYLVDNPDSNVAESILVGLNTVEDNLTALITQEGIDRAAAITNLNSSLTTVINTVQANLTAEIAAREAADTTLSTTINTNETASITRDDAIGLRIDQELIDRAAQDGLLRADLDTLTTTVTGLTDGLAADIQSEETARTFADAGLQTQIDANATDIAADAARITTLETKEAALMLNVPVGYESLRAIYDYIVAQNDAQDVTIAANYTNLDGRVTTNTSDIATETAARVAGDALLQTNIDTLDARVTTEVGTLNTAITTESTARTAADAGLQSQVDAAVAVNDAQTIDIAANAADIALEATTRATNDDAIKFGLGTQLAFDSAAYKSILDLNNALGIAETDIASNTSAITTETATRVSEITRVEGLVTAETTARTTADTTLQGNIDAEAGARAAADTALDGRLTTAEGQLADILFNSSLTADTFAELEALIGSVETAAAANLATAEATLQTNINSNTTAITTESTTRANADIAINTTIAANETDSLARDNTLQGNIDAEAATRLANDNTLQSNITAEATARASADTTLQTNIDAKPDTLLELLDTPAGYVGNETFLVRVKADGTGVEFVSALATVRHDVMLDSLNRTGTTYDAVNTDQIDTITYAGGYTAVYTYDATILTQINQIEYFDTDGLTLIATKVFAYDASNRLNTVSWVVAP